MADNDKFPIKQLPRRKRGGKRVRVVREVLTDTGYCPVQNMIRVAIKAENAKQYSVAAGLWKELQSYMEPKFKAIDPLEQAQKAKDIMGLEDLRKIKEAILEGDVGAVQEALPIPDAQVVEGDLL